MSRIGEISDDYVDAFYRLVEGDTRKRCPECRCPMTFDHETGLVICPKCNYTIDE